VSRYAADLEALPSRLPLPEPLGLEALDQFRREHQDDAGVHWERLV
jgi:hypothetical protein